MATIDWSGNDLGRVRTPFEEPKTENPKAQPTDWSGTKSDYFKTNAGIGFQTPGATKTAPTATYPDFQDELTHTVQNAVQNTQQGVQIGSFGDFGQFWQSNPSWNTADSFLNAANLWNRYHPNDPVTLTGHSGDAVSYRGQVYDGIFNVGSGDARNQWIVPGGDGGGGATGGGGNTQSTYGNSPNTELYVNEILSRLQQLHQPVNDPMRPALYTSALKRVNDLQTNAPYTAGEDAALIAHYRDPLTQARDAEYQRNREQASARGLGRDSGLIDILDKNTNQGYERGIAQGANDLGVRAVQEKQARQQEALGILVSLVQAEKQKRDEENQQAQSLIQTASLLPGMDERRLQLLIQAGQDGSQASSSSLNTLMQLAQLNQNQSHYNQQTDQASAEAWGQWLASVLGSQAGS
jgi:hypothetical protein